MADTGVVTLAIETSNPSSPGEPGVALGLHARGKTTPIDAEPLGSGERHDDLLMPAIARLFDRTGHRPAELGRVAVSIGPGGYTGLRIATAAASSIAMATGAEVAGVPSAWVVAGRLPPGGPSLVCLACKGDSAWVTRFDGRNLPTDDGRLCTAADLGLQPGDRLVGDRFLPEAFREAASRAGAEVLEPRFEPEACLELAWRVEASQTGLITPLYGREAEAVTRWRELHGTPDG